MSKPPQPASIIRLRARQILDSRGSPTVEVDVELHDGCRGRASVPSGASTGRYEARELRDGDDRHFGGRGVRTAVANVCGEIAQMLLGLSAEDQEAIDHQLIRLDGTPDLRRLGANAVLATSLAVCRAAAAHRAVPLYRYLMDLAENTDPSLPMPMTNILSGGRHAAGRMDFQDFLAIPLSAERYCEALEMLVRVRSSMAQLMRQAGRPTLLADEGGFSPGCQSAQEALELMVRAIEHAGLQPGADVAIAVDVAAGQLFRSGRYQLDVEGRSLIGDDMVTFVAGLVRQYPVISVEDPLDQDDWQHWRRLTQALSGVQLIGDDLFATNPERLAAGIKDALGNAILIKPNQNGTLTGTLAVMKAARKAGYATVISARSGETEDSFIADLAVGTGARQIKIGSVCSSERLAKYNQLLRLEEDPALGFAGCSGIAGRQ